MKKEKTPLRMQYGEWITAYAIWYHYTKSYYTLLHFSLSLSASTSTEQPAAKKVSEA